MSQSVFGASRLLARLDVKTLENLEPDLQRVPLEFKQVVYEALGAIDYVYFPTRGVVSALNVMADGAMIEVGNIGREGVAGIYAMLGPTTSPNKMIVQIEGEALRIAAPKLEAATVADPDLRRVLSKYHAAYAAQVSQSVACNGLHPLMKRCCRWLLMTHDRVDGDEFDLSHDFLAMMLGVRRAGVTEALQELREKGLIDYTRGNIVVTDRAGLEEACCECYAFVESEYERIMA